MSGRSPRDGCRRSGSTGCSARSCASTPTDRFRRTTRSSGTAGARPEIWSIGHRNIQGAALNPATGELWEVEHGARGGDEINIARKGKDYGWPTIAYGIEYNGMPITGHITAKEGMEQPRYYWDPVIGPSGMTFYTGDLFPAWKGSLFIGGHQTEDLVRLTLDGEKVVGEERLLTDLKPQRERIRDVRQGPDGALYLLTDSAAGRLLKLVPRDAKGGPCARGAGPAPTNAARASRRAPSPPPRIARPAARTPASAPAIAARRPSRRARCPP